MERRTIGTDYALDLEMDDFAELSDSDRIGWDGPTLEEEDLPDKAWNLEFSGHFGPSVFYTVDADDDTPELHAEMASLIEDKVAAIRTYRKALESDSNDQ